MLGAGGEPFDELAESVEEEGGEGEDAEALAQVPVGAEGGEGGWLEEPGEVVEVLQEHLQLLTGELLGAGQHLSGQPHLIHCLLVVHLPLSWTLSPQAQLYVLDYGLYPLPCHLLWPL